MTNKLELKTLMFLEGLGKKEKKYYKAIIPRF